MLSKTATMLLGLINSEPHPVKKTVKKLKESLQVGSAVAN